MPTVMPRAYRTLLLAITLSSLLVVQAQTRVTTPKQEFGFNIGDDYSLANYTQYVDYLKKLDRESDRLTVKEIGKSSEGRTMYLAIVTSPANQKNLTRYQEIAGRLAHAEGLTDDQARALAEEGRAVVWIDGGIHANEVLGAQQLIENIYQLVSRTDAETMRFLNDVIVLNCLVNPDGMELVSNWYMKERDTARRTLSGIPRLYNKYAGHDNNRDFYMTALAETEAINTVLFRDWLPQIVYDHHQTGPAGAVMFSPPFRDPFNYFLDPMVISVLDEVGAAMHSRFAMESKAGVTSRSGANYSTWWNGGLRTSPYFHNQIGLLTETIGSPTPTEIAFVPAKMVPNTDTPLPIGPQSKWHFRQSIEYSITANRAVIDYASRNKDRLLFNVYRMGKNSIDRGSRDTWTITPRRLRGIRAPEELRTLAARDPRGYVIPFNQPDFLTAVKFANALIKNGVTVLRAAAPFSINGKSYPAGSFVVKTDQAFRPQVLDMFEPQDHPDDFAYQGAPPTPPYDIAGWTLAFQMGIRFDRILEGFERPFERLQHEVQAPAGRVSDLPNPAGYVFSHELNDSFVAVNRLLGSNEEVRWTKNSFSANGKTYPPGTQFVRANAGTLAKLRKMSEDIGLSFEAVAANPAGESLLLRPHRIALWDRAGGSVPSGWTRYVLEKFEFPHTVVTNLDQTNLSQRFDVLILVDDAIAPPVPQLKKFLEDGGVVLAIGRSTRLAYQLDLPIIDALANLTRRDFYIPGSVLRARIDPSKPLAYGMPEYADVFFDNSAAFRVNGTAGTLIAWYDSAEPLRSGWAWGQKALENAAAVVEVNVGKGKLVLYGPEVLFRSQPHGTYKLFFNGLFLK